MSMDKKLVISLDEYGYSCADGCCYNYGIVTTLNGEKLPVHNVDASTILKQVLEKLGYEVEITETFDFDN